VLAGERVALNFDQQLSGVATITRRFADLARPARVFDTRKTTPGLRALEKYAVRCGGGHNHRMGLSDGVMIKDNHIAAIGDLDALREKVEALASKGKPVVLEAATYEQALLFATFPVQVLMLDNFDVPGLKRAVRAVRNLNPKLEIEASGGVNLKTVAAIARTGVDRVSVGALTHSAPAVDISLEL
jgi:nicotinate-nucleotide pyrophosphorylase (carboxylating)